MEDHAGDLLMTSIVLRTWNSHSVVCLSAGQMRANMDILGGFMLSGG
jgi:hypothetical protein